MRNKNKTLLNHEYHTSSLIHLKRDPLLSLVLVLFEQKPLITEVMVSIAVNATDAGIAPYRKVIRHK